MEEGGSDVVGDRFLAGQVTGTLAGEDGGQFVIGQAASLGGDDMGVKLVAEWNVVPVTRIATSRAVRGSDGETESANVRSQIGLPNFGSCSQGFHGPEQRAIFGDALKPWKFFSMPARMSS